MSFTIKQKMPNHRLRFTESELEARKALIKMIIKRAEWNP